MSEQNNNTFSFAELTDQEGLDINAIFGDASPTADVNPFDAPAQPQAAAPQPAAIAPVPVTNPAPSPLAQDSTPEPTPSASPAQQTAAPVQGNLIEAAFQQQEAENTKTGLFERLPVFSYGSAKEEITDTSMTFEELRIAKSEDFPELAEGKRVSWTVEYGKSTKAIVDPKGTTIASVKAELERSKAILDNLRKAKDKHPTCLVKPKVTAQSKGIASYKGIFSSLEDARASDKTICLIPSRDGSVYELRKTELGEFIAPKNNIVEFPLMQAGFTPALPLIPKSMMEQIISFFRSFMQNRMEYEALVHIYWDREKKEFRIHIPKQRVTKTCVTADLSQDALPEDRFLHYADVHSHNSMPAQFSSVDDLDEQATRLYIVIGQLDQFFPEVSARVSCGGTFLHVDLHSVAEPLDTAYPDEWDSQVQKQEPPFRQSLHTGDGIGASPLEYALSVYKEMLHGADDVLISQLLYIMKQDCVYFLEEGQHQVKHLWGRSITAHTAMMKALWICCPPDKKPEWLSYAEIEQYEKRMLEEG